MSDLTDALADGPLASDGTVLVQTTAAGDTLSFSEVWSPTIIPGGVAGDALKVTESFTLTLTRNVSLNESLTLASVMQLLAQASITEHFAVTQGLMAWVNLIINDGFKVRSYHTTSFTYGLTISQAIYVAQALDQHNAITVTDSFVARQTLGYAFTAGAAIVEALRVGVNMSINLILRIASTEVIDMDDASLLNFIYSDTISETIIAEILYQSPDGNITTWAINTRTNAVSEYQSFAFNSFASMGRKYLAASRDGLYELNGVTDNNAPVMARFGGGYFQPNGAKFAGLKGVYIGAAGRGNYLLKLITGDGIERVYRAVLNPGLMTTKINMGKGIRARYMAWELINEDGQDFDFDQIEFVPMMSGRRV